MKIIILLLICLNSFGQWGAKGQSTTINVSPTSKGTTIYTKTGMDKQVGLLNTQIANLQTTVNGLLITVNSQSQIIGAQSTTITKMKATIDSLSQANNLYIGRGAKALNDSTLLPQVYWDNICNCPKPNYQ